MGFRTRLLKLFSRKTRVINTYVSTLKSTKRRRRKAEEKKVTIKYDGSIVTIINFYGDRVEVTVSTVTKENKQ